MSCASEPSLYSDLGYCMDEKGEPDQRPWNYQTRRFRYELGDSAKSTALIHQSGSSIYQAGFSQSDSAMVLQITSQVTGFFERPEWSEKKCDFIRNNIGGDLSRNEEHIPTLWKYSPQVAEYRKSQADEY